MCLYFHYFGIMYNILYTDPRKLGACLHLLKTTFYFFNKNLMTNNLTQNIFYLNISYNLFDKDDIVKI